MSEYPPELNEEAERDVDPRIVAMHRVVDLERQHERAAREAEQRQKMAAIVREELREAKDALSGLLGYPSNGGGVKMPDVEAIKRELSPERYR